MRSTRIIPILITLTLLTPSVGQARSKHVDKAAKKIEESGAPNMEPYFNGDMAAMDQKAHEENSGSLWSNTYSARLYDNMYRASRIGDTIMIVVDERSQGSNKGNTKSDKKMEHDASIDELGGLMNKLTGIFKALSPTQLIKGSTESKFKGDASTNRQGELDAQITATVTQILKNGNMVVKGEKHLKINKEDQILIVEGIIRPYDIMPNNTVSSGALANARISYTGFGVVAERQSPGWLVRALDYIWPF
jgi:flagellar L-ring protein FlgH